MEVSPSPVYGARLLSGLRVIPSRGFKSRHLRQTEAMISVEDYLAFVDDALHARTDIVTGLGDDLANVRPDLPGSNSPYAILTHCLGVMEWWAGHVVAGRDLVRDRDAEFTATGSVGQLASRTERQRRQLDEDLAALDPYAAPRGSVDPRDAGLPLGRTQGGALLHVYEELAQHRGHMELTRDMLRAPWVP